MKYSNHVQKRMSTSLKELKRKCRFNKLADCKEIGEIRKLTDKKIEIYRTLMTSK